MEFIDKLKSMGSETYKYTTEKTSKIARETKLKMKINQNKSQIEDIYEEIGKAIYQEHIREEKTDINNLVKEYCEQIDNLSNEIEEIGLEILNLKDKKKCDICATEMDIEDKFCPQCGKEQPEKTVKEVEITNENEASTNSDIIETDEFTEDKNEQEEYANKINNEENNEENEDKEE